MIKIIIPSKFLPEKKYILNVIFSEVYNLDYCIEVEENSEYYKICLPNGNALFVEDHFFRHFDDGLSYLNTKHIPTRIGFAQNAFLAEEDIPVIFGTPKLNFANYGHGETLICGIDVFASSFFMLSRWEEHANIVHDQHQRFPAAASLAYQQGFLNRPVVNEYIEMLWRMLQRLGFAAHCLKRNFCLCPTHDIDKPFYYWNKQLAILRYAAGDIVKRGEIISGVKKIAHLAAVKFGQIRDPFDRYEFFMDVSEGLGVKSCFFFKGGGQSSNDTCYELSNKSIQKRIQRINERGHFVGLHPSYDTYNNPDMWQRELLRLRQATGRPITTCRQHVLRFEVPTTWQIMEDSGMTEDQTLSYAEQGGFRCGICYPFPVFNIITRKTLRLRERPLIAMEGTFVEYLGLTPSDMAQRVQDLLDKVKKYKGDFVFLWHNSSFYIEPWNTFEHIYPSILRACDE